MSAQNKTQILEKNNRDSLCISEVNPMTLSHKKCESFTFLALIAVKAEGRLLVVAFDPRCLLYISSRSVAMVTLRIMWFFYSLHPIFKEESRTIALTFHSWVWYHLLLEEFFIHPSLPRLILMSSPSLECPHVPRACILLEIFN